MLKQGITQTGLILQWYMLDSGYGALGRMVASKIRCSNLTIASESTLL